MDSAGSVGVRVNPKGVVEGVFAWFAPYMPSAVVQPIFVPQWRVLKSNVPLRSVGRKPQASVAVGQMPLVGQDWVASGPMSWK